MPKNKRKWDRQTNTKNDRNRSRSTKEEIIPETIEPNNNNNYTNESGGTAPRTSCTGVNPTPKMTGSRTKVIHKHTDTEAKDSTLNPTERNNYPTSNASETSLSSFLQEIDEKMAALRPKVERAPKLNSKKQKKLIKSEPAEMNDDADESSVTEVRTDSISQISKPEAKPRCRPRARRPKKLVKSKKIVKDVNPTDNRLEVDSTSDSVKPEDNFTCKDEAIRLKRRMKQEPLRIDDSSACTNEDISLATDVQIDLMSRKLRPGVKRACKSRSRPPKKTMKSEEIMVDDKDLTTTGDTLSNSWLDIVPTSEMQKKSEPIEISSDPDFQIVETPSATDLRSKPKVKFVCKKGRGRRQKQISKCRAIVVEDNPIVISSDSLLEMESTSEKAKPKKSGVRRSGRSTEWKKIDESEPIEINSNPGCQSEDTPIVTEIQTDLTSEILQPNERCEGRNITPECNNKDLSLTQVQTDLISETPKPKTKCTRKSRSKELKKFEINNNPAISQTDSLSETLKIEDNPTYNSGEKSVDTISKISDDHTDITNNLSSENDNLSSLIPERVKIRYPFLDKMYQPEVILLNIAHSDILSPKQRKRLSRNKQSENSLTVKDATDSSTDQSIKPSTPSNIIDEVNPEPEKRNGVKPVEDLPNNTTCEDEHPNPRERRIRTKGKKRTRSKVSELKSWDEMYKSKLAVRNSVTNSRSENETDVLSSIGNEEFNIYKCSTTSTGVSLKQGSLAQSNDFGKKLTETSSTVPTEEQILMWPLPEMLELEIPLDLTIRNSDKSISIQSDFSKPDDSIGEISSGTSKLQSQDIDKHNTTGFGSSTFNITNLSTSFTEIDEGKQSENINIRKNPTPQKYRGKDQTMSFHTPPQSAEKIFPTTSTASKSAAKKVKSKTTVSAKPKKFPPQDTVSIKVSLPAEHYFNEKHSTSKKSDTVDERKKKTSRKADTKSHTRLDKTDNRASKSSRNLTSDKKPSKRKSTKSETSTRGKSHQCVGSSAPLPDMCRLVDKDTDFGETLRRCDINYAAASDQTLLGPIITKPKITNVRSQPKIVSDEFLPKGTITLPSGNYTESTVPCTFSVKVENKSYFENIKPIEKNQEFHELAIHKQSTSVENVSQFQPTAVNNLEEFDNSHGISLEQVSQRLQIDDCTDQSSVVDKNFDSTQLWKICPELEDYFSHDDVVNNNDNNEKKLSNFCDRNIVKNTEIDNRLRTISTKIETETNLDNSTELRSNSIIHVSENANNLRDVFKGVVAMNVDYNDEMEVESSESIAPQIESSSTKFSVIANLTAANLRNFNDISNHDVKGGLNWSADTCQYYLSQGDVRRHSDKLVPNIAFERSCGSTESTSGSRKDSSPFDSKKRKRKWIDKEKNSSSKPTKEKRLKLNRNRWSVDGQDFGNSIVSINTDNTVTSNVVEKKSSYQDIDKAKKKIERELNVAVEKIEASQDKAKRTVQHESNVAAEKIEANQSENNNKLEELGEKIIVDSTATNENKNIETLRIIPVRTQNSETLKCDFGNDSRLQSELNVILPQHAKDDDSHDSIDKNGNLKTSSSSSSSSSSQSSKSSSNHEESIHSKNSNKKKTEKYVPEPHEKQCKMKEENEEEVDDDCISLFAESLFTNFDQPTDVSYFPSCKPTIKEPEEKFQDMSDVGAYFDRNVQECNEAYEYCAQEDKRRDNNSQDMADGFANKSNVKLIPKLLELNASRPNFSPPRQYFERNLCPVTSIHQKPNLSSITNLKDRPGEKGGTTNTFPAYVEGLFDWHCYQKLKQGLCNRIKCRFDHQLVPSLQRLDLKSPEVIMEVIDYAISNGYIYFIQHKYPQVIRRLDYIDIMKLFYKLYKVDLIGEYFVECTIEAITKIGVPLRRFLNDVASFIDENDDTVAEYILRIVGNIVELGTYWNTCRDLLIAMKPSNISILPVLYECTHKKDKLQVRDVYLNYARRLTPDQVSGININLQRQFNLLLVENDSLDETDQSNQPALFDNVNQRDSRLSEMNVAEDNCKGKIHIPTILSPDDTAQRNYENLLPISTSSSTSLKISQKSSPHETLTKNQDNIPNSTTSNRSSLYQRRGATSTPISAEANQQSPDFNIRTTEPAAANSSSNSFTLHQIDNLQSPRSKFRDRHWKIHLDVTNLKEALKHSEYPLALSILDKYSEMEKTIFTTSCYRMLRQNVAASVHHVKNMIKLSVRIGVNKFLNETLVNLGMYMMIELCSTKAWVLAYNLFKSLQYSATLTESNATFALITAEICLANRRPLKAFIILKQNNMLCTNRSEWNVVSEPNDERVRVMIVNLLLDVLCQEYPDRAFYIFTCLVKDQTRIYHPVDLTAHIDELATGLLRGKYNDSISDLGRLIIEKNFTLKSSVFQSLIVNIYQNDIALCRQLYRYGTWLGLYPIVKSTLPLHIFIKTNWTKEEMYLVIVDFLEKLSLDIGPAVDHIGPNQFKIHLVFELMPFKQHLPENNFQISNKDELKMSKELMKRVLQEQFNPPLRTIIAERERFMKLQSRSVVNYLKSMLVEK